MLQCVVIADDLTGANATGVLLSKIGLKTYTVMNQERISLTALSFCDCVVYPTDSRGLPSDIAYNRVFNVARTLKSPDVRLYSKRIDSTLRGNLGSETDALLDALQDSGRMAMVVGCFPSSGRITVGGYLLVNGLPLHKTEAALDPKAPIHTSLVADIYRVQSKYPVGSVSLEDLKAGERAVADRIALLKNQGVRIVVFDAITQEDIEQIADSVLLSGVSFAAVDPGVFTAALSRKLIEPQEHKKAQRILAVVGSVNAVARMQVEQFLLSQQVHNVYIETAELLEGEAHRQAEIQRVAAALVEGCEHFEVCSIIGCGIVQERRVSFEPYMARYCCTAEDLSEKINTAIAKISDLILASDKGFMGVYSCGGDITAALCKRFDTVGLRLLDEVVPLAAYGELMGGRYNALKIVTKGGMVGDKNALVTCIHYLKERLLI